MLPSPPRIFGYDPVLLAQLKPGGQSAINLLTEAWLISSAVLSAAVGYALWLVENSFAVSLVVSIGMWLVVVNLLRVVVAGGGAAPHQSAAEVRGYRPALGPTFVLSLLALILAQPGQLPLWQEQLDLPVTEHRAQMIVEQERLVRELGGTPNAHFRAELERSSFLAFRVQEIWKQPTRAFALSGCFWFLVLLPTFAGRFLALGALRQYEELRWNAARAMIEHAAHHTARRVDHALSPFPSYGPGSRAGNHVSVFAAAPFLCSRANPRASTLRRSPAPPGRRRWPWRRS